MDKKPSTLIDKYGGIVNLSLIIYDFYQKVKKSPTLSPYFKEFNTYQIIRVQIKLFSYLMGGPDFYNIYNLQTAHQKLHIKEKDFLEFVDLLRNTMVEKNLEQTDIDFLIEKILSFKIKIVQSDPPNSE